MSGGTPVREQETETVEFTDVDLNSNATADLYDPSTAAITHSVHLPNGGSTAVVQLEVTDGTDTAILTPGQGAGDGIAWEPGTYKLSASEKLQANVTTVEGSALTETAAVSRAARD